MVSVVLFFSDRTLNSIFRLPTAQFLLRPHLRTERPRGTPGCLGLGSARRSRAQKLIEPEVNGPPQRASRAETIDYRSGDEPRWRASPSNSDLTETPDAGCIALPPRHLCQTRLVLVKRFVNVLPIYRIHPSVGLREVEDRNDPRKYTHALSGSEEETELDQRQLRTILIDQIPDYHAFAGDTLHTEKRDPSVFQSLMKRLIERVVDRDSLFSVTGHLVQERVYEKIYYMPIRYHRIFDHRIQQLVRCFDLRRQADFGESG
jgi:hypothetical protein